MNVNVTIGTISNFDVNILVKCEHAEHKYLRYNFFTLWSPIYLEISFNLYLPSQHQKNDNNYDQQNSTKNSHHDVDKLRIWKKKIPLCCYKFPNYKIKFFINSYPPDKFVW